jgi:hypothetical protein
MKESHQDKHSTHFLQNSHHKSARATPSNRTFRVANIHGNKSPHPHMAINDEQSIDLKINDKKGNSDLEIVDVPGSPVS